MPSPPTSADSAGFSIPTGHEFKDDISPKSPDDCSLAKTDQIDHPTPTEDVFYLTQEEKKHDGRTSYGLDGGNIQDSLLDMEDLDKQLEHMELECKRSDAFQDFNNVIDVSLSPEKPLAAPDADPKATGFDHQHLLGLEGSALAGDNQTLSQEGTQHSQQNPSRLEDCQAVNEKLPHSSGDFLSGVSANEEESGKQDVSVPEKVTEKEMFPTLEFPVAIDIKDIGLDPGSGSNMSCISMHGSVQSSIERNKNLCSVAGGNNLLTIEEEERIAEMLALEDGDSEKYGGIPPIGEEREAELDDILRGLGYNIENEDDQVGDDNSVVGNDKDDECESRGRHRGDPVLRELAKQRIMDEHERRIDRALRALLREPLPPVIRIPEDGMIVEGEDGVSLLPSMCDETMLTTLMTEEDIQQLIEQVRKELEDDDLELADHQSVRILAQSIVDEESSKRSACLD